MGPPGLGRQLFVYGCTALAGCVSVCAWAAGTAAGFRIENTVSVNYAVGGNAESASQTVQTFVDELLDVAVVSDNATPVPVSSPAGGAVLQFSVTNTGNGNEAFRLRFDDALSGDNFDPSVNNLFLESNAVAGLQIGASGDEQYLLGSNDPLLAPDESRIVYVASSVPAALAPNDLGTVELRAIADTVFAQSGTDDPGNAAFPNVADTYPDAGDARAGGAGFVTAVVGTAHDTSNLLLSDAGSYQVNLALVQMTKNAINVVDPSGGATLVPGSRITYEIAVTVGGAGTTDSLLVTDDIPSELEYSAGTLTVSALPVGEEVDDDFAPAGIDNTGFDPASGRLSVNLGDLAGGSPTIIISFQAAIR